MKMMTTMTTSFAHVPPGSQLQAPSFFERREVIELRAKLLGEAKNLRISSGMNHKPISKTSWLVLMVD